MATRLAASMAACGRRFRHREHLEREKLLGARDRIRRTPSIATSAARSTTSASTPELVVRTSTTTPRGERR